MIRKVFLPILIIALAGFVTVATSQPARFSAEVGPVIEGTNGPLANAWAGGLNAPQITVCNLNNDGVQDLFVFERIGNRVMTFLGQRGPNGFLTYQYAPWYEQQFPRIDYWAQMHDYDCDGIEDLYMSDPFGVRVFRTTGTGRNINFIPQGNYLTTKGFSGSPVNLQVNYADQPLIKDLDGDGDLDMLSVTFGGSTIEFNRNVSKDSTGQCGLQYQKASACWGGLFLANTCGAFTFGVCRNSQVDGPIVRQGEVEPMKRPMHMGTTIEVADFNGDGIKDLMTGDIGCTELYAFPNSGTAAAPRFANTIAGFPTTSVPAQFFSFLGARSVDIDGDGDQDLLVMPNIEKNENYLTDLTASCWLYENRGTNQAPNYQLSTRSYMQSGMLDLGESTYPAFADADGDGDPDLFVGHAAKRTGTNYNSSIWYFENIGTSQQAHFVLRNQDYLSLSTTGQLMLRPNFADINTDGLLDFYYTGTDILQRQSFSGYLLNQGGPGLNFTGASWQNFQLSNQLGVIDSPVFIDLTSDGLPDMLVGRGDGTIALYLNTGTRNQPAFTLNNSNWGSLNVPFGYSLSLTLGDLNADGIQDLITGDETGYLRVYYNIEQQGSNPTLLADTTIMRDIIDNVSSQWYMGRHVVPAVANLTGDTRQDIVIGQRGGGLLYLENVSLAPLVASKHRGNDLAVTLSPNPSNGSVRIGSSYGQGFTCKIISLTGQLIWESAAMKSYHEVDFSSIASSGVYVVYATSQSGEQTTQRLVINR